MTTPSRRKGGFRSDQPIVAATIDLLHLRGYLAFHLLPVTMVNGRVVSRYQGDAGFPDIIGAGHGRLLALEVKGAGGYPNADQRAWLEAIDGAIAEAHVVRPRDWADGTVERLLRPGGP